MQALLQKLKTLAGLLAKPQQAEVPDVEEPRPASGFMSAKVAPAAMSLAMVAAATAALFAAKGILPLLNLVSIVYLVPVLVAATRWGLAPAVLSAFAGAAAADFFFYPPLFSFEIGDTQNLADLAIFLIIAGVTSHYAARLKRKSDSLRHSRRELRSLYAFSRRLAACFTVPDLIAATGNYLSETLGRRAVLVGFGETDETQPAFIPDRVWREAAAMTAAGAGETRTIHDADTQHDWLIRAASVGTAGSCSDRRPRPQPARGSRRRDPACRHRDRRGGARAGASRRRQGDRRCPIEVPGGFAARRADRDGVP
jgi:K+-sensing histidine kinase KdpD